MKNIYFFFTLLFFLCYTQSVVAQNENKLIEYNEFTDLFIFPGFEFKVVNKLITNFHLPKSSLFILVCAFSGKKNVIKLYKKAIKNKLRFFSYGDAMLLDRNEF